MTYPHINTVSAQTIPADRRPEADWHALVLWGDDTDSDLKGLWGPYESVDAATAALEELRMWPLDGRWDLRRLNKFVALKAAAGQVAVPRFTWQS